MQKFNLDAEKRTITGSKVKKLRKEGLIPANLFGKTIDSQAIQVSSKEFNRVYKEAGETSLIWIKIKDEDKDRPTLVTSVHFNPVSGDKLHIDFHQVNLKEKVTANVPVEIIGESDLITSNEAVLSQSLSEIEVEALPTEIPENIIFDISSLKAIGDQLKVSDAKLPEGVELITDPEQMVVSLQEPQKEEEPLPVEEEAGEDSESGEKSAEDESKEDQPASEEKSE